ncbi:MAG: ribosome maturation factor RimP [Candidatus Nanopelagicales bacterium]
MVDANVVRDYLDGALSLETFFIDSVQAQKAGKRTLLTVAIDSFEQLTLDEIARASRVIDGLLEVADIVKEASYTLEVTSRGVEAPLVRPHHFILNIGRLVRIKLISGTEQTLRIQSANDDSLMSSDGEVLQYSDIESAFVQIEFNRKSHDED